MQVVWAWVTWPATPPVAHSPVHHEQRLESVLSAGVTGVITDDAQVQRSVAGLHAPG